MARSASSSCRRNHSRAGSELAMTVWASNIRVFRKWHCHHKMPGLLVGVPLNSTQSPQRCTLKEHIRFVGVGGRAVLPWWCGGAQCAAAWRAIGRRCWRASSRLAVIEGCWIWKVMGLRTSVGIENDCWDWQESGVEPLWSMWFHLVTPCWFIVSFHSGCDLTSCRPKDGKSRIAKVEETIL